MQDAVFHNFQIHVFLISLYLFYITVNIGRGIYNLDFRFVRLELRSKMIVDTMNLKHVAMLNLLHYTGGILQYHSTSANYVRV